ncbi:extracellular solute-binding protein [Luteipulveratus mongoliensis]|uniref:Sugar ABC transporter substrate-binding protein n=1 Tax=Luteipulveratus mongoliensis TaxID=571913 RepID=A0A0K1JLF1_9MICO|nr:extracellular solute-binding protein [Luteipulveratus mongoliensis]AKU17541.1 sugar ABC transporter substrate-binding protein [Luteipulveratus mongoliensis]
MSSSFRAGQVDRRTFLALSGSALGALALSSCSGKKSGSGGAKASADLKLPTYRAYKGVAPELPGSELGLEPGFLSFPKDAVASVKAPPLKSDVSALTETFATPPPPMGSNAMWQALNGALGGKLRLVIGTDPGYPEKFATLLASDSLPDLMWLPPNQDIPNIAPMLEAKFQDLTPHLSGDAVLEYPNLAALKPASWKTAVVNGKIWGAPIPSTPFGQVMMGNPKVWKKVGGLQCHTAEEFLGKCKELSTNNKYALEPAVINMIHMFSGWYGAPNSWSVGKDRSLTHLYETDAYRQAVEFAVKLWQAKVFYPDINLADATPRIVNGQIAAAVSSGPRDTKNYRALDPTLFVETMIPFGWDGKAKPHHDMGYGTVGFTPFKKASEGRIKELLALINYLSAPFGTKEYLQKNYGNAGQQYSLDAKGSPVLTAAGNQQAPGLVSALTIMSAPESVIFNAGHPEDTRAIHATEERLLTMAVRNPTAGTYSDAQSKLGPKLTEAFRDTMLDIVTGRKKMSAYDEALKRWRSGGGDKIRGEFEAVLPTSVPVSES